MGAALGAIAALWRAVPPLLSDVSVRGSDGGESTPSAGAWAESVVEGAGQLEPLAEKVDRAIACPLTARIDTRELSFDELFASGAPGVAELALDGRDVVSLEEATSVVGIAVRSGPALQHCALAQRDLASVHLAKVREAKRVLDAEGRGEVLNIRATLTKLGLWLNTIGEAHDRALAYLRMLKDAESEHRHRQLVEVSRLAGVVASYWAGRLSRRDATSSDDTQPVSAKSARVQESPEVRERRALALTPGSRLGGSPCRSPPPVFIESPTFSRWWWWWNTSSPLRRSSRT